MGLPWQASSRGLPLERGVNNVGPMAVAAVKGLEALGVRAADAVTRLPAQVTTDRSNKTQPTWSPDGRRLAFTVWNYDAQFWRWR